MPPWVSPDDAERRVGIGAFKRLSPGREASGAFGELHYIELPLLMPSCLNFVFFSLKHPLKWLLAAFVLPLGLAKMSSLFLKASVCVCVGGSVCVRLQFRFSGGRRC